MFQVVFLPESFVPSHRMCFIKKWVTSKWDFLDYKNNLHVFGKIKKREKYFFQKNRWVSQHSQRAATSDVATGFACSMYSCSFHSSHHLTWYFKIICNCQELLKGNTPNSDVILKINKIFPNLAPLLKLNSETYGSHDLLISIFLPINVQ